MERQYAQVREHMNIYRAKGGKPILFALVSKEVNFSVSWELLRDVQWRESPAFLEQGCQDWNPRSLS